MEMNVGMEQPRKVMEKIKTGEMEMKVGLDKPSNNLIYGSSILSILLSLFLVRRNPILAIFTGLWAPTIMGLGIYLKENRLIEMERRHVS